MVDYIEGCCLHASIERSLQAAQNAVQDCTLMGARVVCTTTMEATILVSVCTQRHVSELYQQLPALGAAASSASIKIACLGTGVGHTANTRVYTHNTCVRYIPAAFCLGAAASPAAPGWSTLP